MNIPIGRLKSSTGLSLAGFLLAILLKQFPDFWWATAVVYIGVCAWVISPQYDKTILNDALLYYLRAAGISEQDQQDIRCCLYIPNGQNLKMVSDYMPGAVASTFIAHKKQVAQSKGIIGRAYRMRESHIDLEPTQFSAQSDYVPYLKIWGFDDSEVALIDKTRKGFCAVPILKPKIGNTSKEVCVGVLYLDTTNPTLLTDSALLDRLESAAMLFEPILSLMTK
jgi:hypothetical protein